MVSSTKAENRFLCNKEKFYLLRALDEKLNKLYG